MSGADPFEDAFDKNREDRLRDRLDGLIQYQSDLLDRIQGTQFSPYCHIPDLFGLDPEARRPFSVPSSFIPEQVGGNVSVTSADGGFLASEPLDLILGSFLPGGYKRRWEFDIWTGNFDPSEVAGFAQIEKGIEVQAREPLSVLVPDAEDEQYTPYHHDVDEVGVYIPKEFYVWNPSVSDDVDITNYFWDPEQKFIHNFKPEDVPEDKLVQLKSDPTSQFLWFKHLLFQGEDATVKQLDALSAGLFEKAEFNDDASFLKCYYATLLTLYGKDRTFSDVIRYRHDGDDQTAFVGSKEDSQVVLFSLDDRVLSKTLDTTLDPNSKLFSDLQFALLYRKLWDRLFFQEEALEHAFSVTPFYTALVALDYTLFAASDTPDSIFETDLETIRETLPSLVPESSSRLGLLDYDDAQIKRYIALFEDEAEVISEILDECRSEEAVSQFAEHVLVHSLKHALASWAAEFSAGGNEFEAWYDVNFQQSDPDTIQIGIYDTIQGGAGVSKEVFDDIQTISDGVLLNGIAEQGCCHIAATEDTAIELLAETEGGLLYDRVQAMGQSTDAEFQSTFESLGDDHRHTEYEDVRPQLRLRLESLAETRELTRFYSAVAEEYQRVEEQIGRTPQPVDIVFALEDRTFFDTRVRQTYERFANRQSQRRDLSEVAERVEEITKQCVRACPDCLKRHSCTHQYRYQEQMLDRRLLTRAISSLDGDSA
ncbi:hypothetical protein GCM10028857_03090 [Salinarchaeum chitinilyticum]